MWLLLISLCAVSCLLLRDFACAIDRQFFLPIRFCHSCVLVSNIPIYVIHRRNQACNAVWGIYHLWLAMFVDMTDMQLSV